MNEVQRLSRLFEYHHWANDRTAASLAGPHGEGRALAILAHMGAAGFIWLGRLTGSSSVFPVWPEWPLEEATLKVRASVSGIRRYLEAIDAAELERVLEYKNTKGEEFRDSVRDILDHVSLHYHYHRGQVATLVARAGGKPASTDFIFYLREKSPA